MKQPKQRRKMKKLLCTVCGIAIVGGIVALVSSRDGRDEAVERVENAARSLVGNDDGTPDIVRRQQRKERIRQNTKWTAENQALHPLEYCQAQLTELERHASQLDVAAHKIAVSQSTTRRRIADAEAKAAETEKFLAKAKDAYRAAEAANSWPMSLNGFALSKEKAQEKIVEAANRIPTLKQDGAALKNTLRLLDKRAEAIVAGRTQLAVVRERIQHTINDLNTKKVLDGEKGISDALNAIADSMAGIGGNVDEPSLDDLMAPAKSDSREATFKEIMAK